MNAADSNQDGSICGMTALPLVSVIIISYRQEAFIEAAVRSCMEQTYANLEIIVSDDASTDATAALAQRLAAGDSRIAVHAAAQNRGITGNVQFALEQCRGKYIAFLGGDDLLYPDKIATQVAVMEADPALALCFTQCHVIHGDDLTPQRVTGATKISDVADGYALAGSFGVEIPGPAPMIRASMVPSGGFRRIAPMASDWLFFIETSYRQRCRLIEVPLAAYRMHDSNIGKNRYAYIGDYCSSYAFIRENYAHDKRLVSLVGGALRRYLYGTYYASIIEDRPDVTVEVVRIYGENFGRGPVSALMGLLSRAGLASLFLKLKPLLKKMV